ncbi:MAG: AAA family ATPase, partial [Armatimonadota bacterium]
ALAAGVAFWGHDAFTIPEPATVIYCTAEGQHGLHKRLAALDDYYRECGVVIPRDRFHVVRKTPQLYDAGSPYYLDAFTEACRQLPVGQIDLVVIDTLNRATLGANENDNSDAAQVLTALERMQRALGCTVLLVHHVGRNGFVRGATAYKAGMDFMLEVTEETGHHYLHCEKLKDAERFKPLPFDLTQRDTRLGTSLHVQWIDPESISPAMRLGHASIFDRAKAFLQEHPGQWFDAKEISEAIGASQRVFLNKPSQRFQSMLVGFETAPIDPTRQKSSHNPLKYRAVGRVDEACPAHSPVIHLPVRGESSVIHPSFTSDALVIHPSFTDDSSINHHSLTDHSPTAVSAGIIHSPPLL